MQHAWDETLARARREWPLFGSLALFILIVFVINPLREMAYLDDWAYALMVQHLLETGVYHLHDWASANPIFQVYWGALFASLLGMSFGSLKISVLVLLAGGLGGMYMLSREHGLRPGMSGLLTIVLFANPVSLMLAFSFMTDIPYVAFVILSLAFYTRALRTRSYPAMLIGSVFALAAILSRAFGLAFVPGLGLSFVFSKSKRETWILYGTGMILPIVGSLWLASTTAVHPGVVQVINTNSQLAYMADPGQFLSNAVSRIVPFLQELSYLSLPLVLLAAVEYWHMLRANWGVSQRGKAFSREMVILGGVVAVLGAAALLGQIVLKQSVVIPVIKSTFYNEMVAQALWLRLALTAVTLIGACLYARALVLRLLRGERPIAGYERLLDWVTLCLLIEQLAYVQWSDRYLLVFLPYLMIIVGRHIEDLLNRFIWPTFGIALALLICSALVVRGEQSWAEAHWNACERTLARGVMPAQVDCRWEWAGYHGSYDRYLRANDGHTQNTTMAGFFDWVLEERESAVYRVRSNPKNWDKSWNEIETIPYQDMFFETQLIYVYQRSP